jgi:excisionase family DNA binding protein
MGRCAYRPLRIYWSIAVKKKTRSSKRKPAVQTLAIPLPSPDGKVSAPQAAPIQAPTLTSPDGYPHIDQYPPWRSPSAASAYLAVSLPTVYRMLRDGELESYAVRKRRRITTASIRWHMLPPSARPPFTFVKPSAPYERLSDPPKRWSDENKRKGKGKARVQS